MKTLALAATLLAVTAAAPAAAAVNVVRDFGNPVFSYGFGSGATGFQAATFSSTCFGNGSLSCYANDPNSVPTVLKNNSATAQSFQTVTVPTDMLLLHPGFNAQSDAVLRFTAATGGVFSVNGSFSRLDNVSGAGTGVNISIFSVNGGTVSTLFSGVIGSSDYTSKAFALSNVTLGTNGQIVFAVNNADEVSYDSTGLSASIAAVPEPATWAMMLLGFGMVGAGLRSRRRQTVRVAFG